MNLLDGKQKANYTATGYFSDLAYKQAQKILDIEPIAVKTFNQRNEFSIPTSFNFYKDAAYTHFIDNQTVQGIQYPLDKYPYQQGVPLIMDSSSSLLTKPINWKMVDMVVAHAQKNCGISGTTFMIINKSLLQRKKIKSTPFTVNYQNYKPVDGLTESGNILPLYSNYLATESIIAKGGTNEQMYKKRAKMLYDVIDKHKCYIPIADRQYRSRINVTWRMPTQQLDNLCMKEGQKNNLFDFKGHRSTNGLRASLFISVPDEGIKKLADFLQEFATKHE